MPYTLESLSLEDAKRMLAAGEAMAEEMKGHVVGGEGKTTETDGGFRRLFRPRQHERKPPRSSPELVADHEQLMKTGLARKSTYRLPRGLRRAA